MVLVLLVVIVFCESEESVNDNDDAVFDGVVGGSTAVVVEVVSDLKEVVFSEVEFEPIPSAVLVGVDDVVNERLEDALLVSVFTVIALPRDVT